MSVRSEGFYHLHEHARWCMIMLACDRVIRIGVIGASGFAGSELLRLAVVAPRARHRVGHR